ncbi:MAG: hypothetical protein ACR2P7_05560 [bacterium]
MIAASLATATVTLAQVGTATDVVIDAASNTASNAALDVALDAVTDTVTDTVTDAATPQADAATDAAPVAPSRSNAAADAATDCAAIRIPEDDGVLTRAERIALLDRILLDSLNTPCPAVDSVGGGGGASGGGGVAGDGIEGADGDSGEAATAAANAAASIPAGDIQGERAEASDAAPRERSDATANRDPAAKDYRRAGDESNGKIPDDIPSAKNDDIIAKQFRQAAIEETDPVVKAKLWNEYRRYKNLPEKKVPESGAAANEMVEAKSKP